MVDRWDTPGIPSYISKKKFTPEQKLYRFKVQKIYGTQHSSDVESYEFSPQDLKRRYANWNIKATGIKRVK